MFTVDDVLTKHYPSVANYPLLSKPLTFLLKRLLHEREMHEFAQLYPHVQGIDFVEQVLDYFKISYSVRDVEKQNIPSEGRLVIIANHPIGSLDALALIKLVAEIRTDIKVVANKLFFLPVRYQDYDHKVFGIQFGKAVSCALPNKVNHLYYRFSLTPKIRPCFTAYLWFTSL